MNDPHEPDPQPDLQPVADAAAAARADTAFRLAAVRGDDLDVAFGAAELPIGEVLVASSRRGLCMISFDPDPAGALDRLAGAFGPRVLRAPARLDAARRELEDYFSGRLHDFDLAVDLGLATPFQRSVLEALRRVPYGETETYGGLAARIGKPRAARAVGGALNRNPVPIVVPCHRVVGAGGALVGYAGGLPVKEALLELERSGAG